MALITDADVKKLETVKDGKGNKEPPANAAEQRAVRDRLGNWDSISAFSYSTSGTDAEQLPANGVPDGVSVLLQAPQTNAETVYIGNDSAQPVEIQAGANATLQVSDTSAIWIRADSAGDSLGVLYEDG